MLATCPICTSDVYRVFHDYRNFQLFQCEACNHIYQPVSGDKLHYNAAQIAAVYNDQWVSMREQYCTDTFRQHTQYSLTLLRAFLRDRATILEIGSGTGEVLYLAQKYRYNIVGVEPSPEARKYASSKYQVTVYESLPILKEIAPGLRFDAICFWHVLEHIPDPRLFLNTIKELLVTDGLIFLSVPNLHTFTNEICGSYSPLFCEQDHLHHFSRANLENLVSENFDIITIFSREEHDRLKSDIQLGHLHMAKQPDFMDLL